MHVEADVHLFHSPAGKKQVCLYILFFEKHGKTLVCTLCGSIHVVFLESFKTMKIFSSKDILVPNRSTVCRS